MGLLLVGGLLSLFFAVEESSCSAISVLIIAAEIVDSNAAGFPACRMNEFSVPHIHPHMGNSRTSGVEEDQVSRFQAAFVDRFAGFGLLGGGARDIDALATIDILRESRTVESARSGRAESIGSSTISICSSHDFVCSDRSIRFRSHSVRGGIAGSVIRCHGLIRRSRTMYESD